MKATFSYFTKPRQHTMLVNTNRMIIPEISLNVVLSKSLCANKSNYYCKNI